jgi:hypothetical protein
MLQASGSTLSSAMTPALSFVMTQGQLLVRVSAVACRNMPALARLHDADKENERSHDLTPPILRLVCN